MPQRLDNKMTQIYSADNVELAIKKSRKGKKCKRAIKRFDADRKANTEKIIKSLQDGTYKTSEYSHKKIYDPKEREISILPYNPDRVAQHAIIGVIEPDLVKKFIPQTYACIKNRGIHKALKVIRRDMRRDVEGTTYCLKIDIRHYYPSIDHQIMKDAVRRMVKDPRLLPVLDNIIDSEDGLPIGNYSSQYLANVYLDRFDHWMKETMGVKYYYRYVDDIVVLSDSKPYLHDLLEKMRKELEKYKLEVKGNYQVFPVEARGIDFLGYVIRHDYVLVRKRVKNNIKKKLQKCIDAGMTTKEMHDAMGSYYGWLKHCDSKHLIQTLNDKANGKVFQQGSSRPRRKMGR